MNASPVQANKSEKELIESYRFKAEFPKKGKAIVLRQLCDVDISVFDGMEQEGAMFKLRLEELKKYIKSN